MKNLKIIEQIIIVFILAVFLPLIVTSFIVINVNQHAVRKELNTLAVVTAENISYRLSKNLEAKQLSLSYMAQYVSKLKTKNERIDYINKANKKLYLIDKLEIIQNDNEFKSKIEYDDKSSHIIISAPINSKFTLREYIKMKRLQKEILNFKEKDIRQIYILDNKNNIVLSYNRDKKNFNEIIKGIPKNLKLNKTELFTEIKNQPNAVIQLEEPNWKIIVSTPQNATNYSIIDARRKIIITIIVSAIFALILGTLYTISLYINIRQLIKAISAIAQGNYGRRIRILKNIFTPHEVLYLSDEFNSMAEEVDSAYNEIHKKNKLLSKIDEYKSNLIDTVSHEFRTPLTSIKGYTSRLLRHYNQLDEETRIKSLKAIKQQTERLSRMVEDLLVIPDIESSTLRIFSQENNLKEIIDDCILSISHQKQHLIEVNIEEDTKNIFADGDRVAQIIINLLENAIKYSKENTAITLTVKNSGEFVKIKVHNECEEISSEVLHSLLGKFTRIDDNLTRTTRGTGLGLFIVKGLTEAMGGHIKLSSANGFEVILTLPIYDESKHELQPTY